MCCVLRCVLIIAYRYARPDSGETSPKLWKKRALDHGAMDC